MKMWKSSTLAFRGAIALVLIVLGLAACSAAEEADALTGTWETQDGMMTWQIDEDTITGSMEGRPDDIESTYTATDTTIEMVDLPGEFACASDKVGTYEWDITDDMLTLTLVNDDCSGRANALNHTSWERGG